MKTKDIESRALFRYLSIVGNPKYDSKRSILSTGADGNADVILVECVRRVPLKVNCDTVFVPKAVRDDISSKRFEIALTKLPVHQHPLSLNSVLEMNAQTARTTVDNFARFREESSSRALVTSFKFSNASAHHKDENGTYLDELRTLGSLLTLCNKDEYHEAKLNLVQLPAAAPNVNFFNSAFCFEKAMPYCSRVEHHLYILRHLLSDRRHDFKINYRMLFSDSLEIKNLYGFFNAHKSEILRSGKFIVYTNRDIDAYLFQKHNVSVIRGSTNNSRQLLVDKNSTLYERLLEDTPLYKLSQIIHKALNNKPTLRLAGLLKEFHLALVNERVIELLTSRSRDTKCFAKFHEDFVVDRNLSEEASEFRSHILRHLGSTPLSRDLRLTLPEKFGKKFIYDENPIVSNLQEVVKILLEHSMDSFYQVDESPILFRTESKLKEDMAKIKGHVLTVPSDEGNTVKFTRFFLNLDEKLSGNLENVRNALKDQLIARDIPWGDLNRCRFKMTNFCDDDSTERSKRNLKGEARGKMLEKFFTILEFQIYNENSDETITNFDPLFREIEYENIFSVVKGSLLELIKSKGVNVNVLLESLRSAISQKKISAFGMDFVPGLEFKPNAASIVELEKLLFNGGNDHTKIAIATNLTFVIILMIKYLVEQRFGVSDGNPRCIVVKLNSWQRIKEYVKDVLRSGVFIIVDCGDSSVTKEQIRNAFNELHGPLASLPASTSKKLIFIAPIDKLSEQLDYRTVYKRCEVEKGFKEMRSSSRIKLLNSVQIKMRDWTVKIEDLLTSEIALEVLSKSGIPTQSMMSPITIHDINSPPQRYNENYQIPGSITQTIIISLNVLKSDNRDVFMIKNISRVQLQELVAKGIKVYNLNTISPVTRSNARFILFDAPITDFDNIAQDYEGNVHLMLYHENGELIWRRSKGSIKSLIPYKQNDRPELSVNEDVCDILAHEWEKDRVVIISGESGSGKSSYLQKLWKLSANSNARTWLVHINLDLEYFARHENSHFLDSNTAVNYVISQLQCDDFQKRIFFMCATQKVDLKVALFIDGYDALPLKLARVAMGMVAMLMKTQIKKIYVTARPGRSRRDLEFDLDVFSYDIREFSESEKMNFLVEYWTKNPDARIDEEQEIPCAQELLTYFEAFHPALISKPLHLQMIADLHKSFDDGEFEIASKIEDTYSLYQTYVHKYLRKVSLSNIVQKSLTRLIPHSKLVELEINENLKVVDQSKRKGKDLPCELSHVTFDEFIVAEWLGKKFLSGDFNQDKVFQCITTIVSTTSPVFFDAVNKIFKLDENFQSLMHLLAKPMYTNFLKALLQSNSQEWSASGLTPLHSAVKSKGLEVVKLLLKHKCPDYENLFHHGKLKPEHANSPIIKFVDRPSNGKTAIDLAADENSVDIACELALAAADLSSLNDHFLQRMSHGFWKYSIKTNQFRNIEFLIPRQLKMVEWEDGNTMLHEAVKMDVSVKILKIILDRVNVNCRNNNGETPLAIAIKNKARIQVIKYLVEKRALLDHEDQNGLYPWCYALLDETGYSKNETDTLMRYFLQTAKSKIRSLPERRLDFINDLRKEEIERKLEYYKDPDHYDLNSDRNKVLRLHSAIKSNRSIDWAWCKFLLKHGAEVSLRDDSKKQPLHVAVEYGRPDLIKCLLQHGAIFDELDGNGQTPLQLLERMPKEDLKNKESLKLLSTAKEYFSAQELPKKDLFEYFWKCRNVKNRTLLHVAAETNSIKALGYLINHVKIAYEDDQPFYLCLRDDAGDTPIHVAAREGHYDIIVKLINSGANYEIKNWSNMTPLDLAIAGNFTKIVQLLQTVVTLFTLVKNRNDENTEEIIRLVKTHPDIVNARNGQERRTLLHWAIYSDCNVRILDNLINLENKHQHVYAIDLEKRTALHYAVENSNLDCVKMLIRAGLPIDCEDRSGRRPFDLGHESNTSRQLLQRIHRVFKDLQSEEPEYMNENPEQFLDLLSQMYSTYNIEPQVVVNARDSLKKTLLHYAVQYHFPEIAVLFLKKGAICNREDKFKNEPIKYAVCCKTLLKNVKELFKHLEVDKWLSMNVDKEIILNARSSNGATLLHESARKGKFEEVKWLLENGANKNASDSKGRSPLHFAKKHKISELLSRWSGACH
ncbi:hypothetical protein QAD02_006863 [Eretmocerus hayati]|uniref:Uncharacterized protein n=1 Tax=Eretmocerus hayati TaxID=131215 RepID=A0ACC2N386_9HYME|nr:hypothetical protein QAD02_006863 [Eretmocerus hayati]